MSDKKVLTPEELERIEEIVKELQNEMLVAGYTIDLAALDRVKKLCHESLALQVIKDTQEYASCVGALFAAGMEKSKETQEKRVTTEILDKGAMQWIFPKPMEPCGVLSPLCLRTNII